MRRLRDLALLLFGALGAFVLATMLSGPLSVLLLRVAGDSEIRRLFLGLIALDVPKIPGLLGAAWLFAPAVMLRPTTVAVLLTAGVFGFDFLLAAALGQSAWLWASWSILLFRLAAALLMALGLRRVVLRRVDDTPAES